MVSVYYGNNANNEVVTGYNHLYGAGGNDRLLVGVVGWGTLDGGDGHDILLFGADMNGALFSGGAGNDTMDAASGAGLCEMFGGAGNDYASGGDAGDYIDGGPGRDALLGSNGADIIRGGPGDESGYITVPDSFNATGNPVFTIVPAGIFGDAGTDRLYGGAGIDRLFGGNERDMLTGGRDRDFLSGGDDIDTFRLTALADSRPGAARDLIMDFLPGIDAIDLSLIDARTALAGNQRFLSLSTTAFHNQSAELLYKAGVLSGDVNGDGTADFQIRLAGNPVIAITDIIL